jgi:NAD(P)-dependent dehydrogenase (short-subunit alcohol dehydrogenase family)
MAESTKLPRRPDLFSLAGRTALVTGASSGFGRRFAQVLAGAGAKVGLAARRIDVLRQLEAEIRADGGQAQAFAMDVTDRASVAGAVAETEAALGPVTVLVNNAGIPSGAFFTKTTEEEWRSVMSVNLDGVYRVGQETARRMVANRTGGSIINIASLLGFGVIKGLSTYSTTKAAVISLTRSMALELARDRIRVNALAPGYFATEFNVEYLASEAGRRMMARVPMARAGAVEELDGPLLLLASDAGAFMTGSVVTVDGGHLLAMG